MSVKLIYVTAPSKAEAEQIAESVLAERLAACANFFDGVTSLFEWDGRLCREQEVILILKTTAEKTGELTARIKELHSYDCPCIVAIPVESGNPDFLSWIHCGVNECLQHYSLPNNTNRNTVPDNK